MIYIHLGIKLLTGNIMARIVVVDLWVFMRRSVNFQAYPNTANIPNFSEYLSNFLQRL